MGKSRYFLRPVTPPVPKTSSDMSILISGWSEVNRQGMPAVFTEGKMTSNISAGRTVRGVGRGEEWGKQTPVGHRTHSSFLTFRVPGQHWLAGLQFTAANSGGIQARNLNETFDPRGQKHLLQNGFGLPHMLQLVPSFTLPKAPERSDQEHFQKKKQAAMLQNVGVLRSGFGQG